MKKQVLLLSLFSLVALTFATKALCRCGPRDKQGWGLREFVNHLHAEGVALRVVPSRADGQWADTIHLTEDPEATWESLQIKSLTAARSAQWRGAVWLHRIGPATDTEGLLQQWEGHGYRIGDFLVFGDARLIEQIGKAFHR